MRTISRALLSAGALVPGSARCQSADSVRSSLRAVDARSGRIDTVYTADRHVEAPNWSPDSRRVAFVVYAIR